MSIRVTCPQCGKTLKAPDSAAGKKAKCPGCQTVLTLPAAPEALEPEPLEPEAADPAASPLADVLSQPSVVSPQPPEQRGTYDLDAPAESPAAAPAGEGEQRRPCPMCGEMIPLKAMKCRFCGEVFDATLKKAEKKKSGSGEDDKLTGGEWALAILCANIACILGIVWMIQGKPKGGKLILAAIVANLIWGVIGFVIGILNAAATGH